MTVAVNDSVVVVVPKVGVAESRTVNGVATCTNTVVTAVPTPPALSRAVNVTVNVLPPPDWAGMT
jgi:hypothetical protein